MPERPIPATRQGIAPSELTAIADDLLADDDAGHPLTELERELIKYGLSATTTALDTDGMHHHGRAVIDAGGTHEQLVTVMLLVAPLGMHTLHEGIRELAELPEAPAAMTAPLDDERSALRQRFEGTSGYWSRLDEQLPGFLDGLLRVSPSAYRGFFEFSALAWQRDDIEPVLKELVYLAIDASPTHRYGPGFRLHLGNARRLGATRRQIEQTLALAAEGPRHQGVRW